MFIDTREAAAAVVVKCVIRFGNHLHPLGGGGGLEGPLPGHLAPKHKSSHVEKGFSDLKIVNTRHNNSSKVNMSAAAGDDIVIIAEEEFDALNDDTFGGGEEEWDEDAMMARQVNIFGQWLLKI